MTSYLPLFTLEIDHAFYTDLRCPDFQIQPAPQTQKALGGLHCVLKPFPNGIRVLAAVDNQGLPFISIPPNSLFSFNLRLLNPDFGLFTDLDNINALQAPLFTNAQSLTLPDLALVSRQASTTETLFVQNPDAQEPFTLGGKPLENLQTSDFAISGLGKVSNPKGYDPMSRVLTVNSAKTASGTPFTVTYPVLPRLGQGIFADVEITCQPPQASLSGNETLFRITFLPKQTRWKYYIVTNPLDNSAAPPSLQDSQNKIVFNPADRTNLNQTPDASDPIASKLVEQYPNKQYYRFISSDMILCQEVARKNIQLLLNGQKVVDALSNPSLHDYSIDTRNSIQEYALHQIVEYFPH